MNDSDILKQLKQPKLLLDIAAGSLSILGVFGCFSDSQIIKQLSMGAVIGGGIGLGTSALMAELYAKTAANALERDLLRKQSAVDAASRKASDLETEVESWKLRHSQAELKVETLENSLDTLNREVIHSRQAKATMEVTLGEFNARLSIALDERNQAQARIPLIVSEFASNAKITLNQAVSDWKSNLVNVLDASLKKRSDLQPQLTKLRSEVTAVCDGHLQAIAQLTHQSNLNQFADEAFTLLWQAASEISSLKVRHRNTLSIGEIAQLRTRVEELESADVISRSDYERVIGNYKSLVDEFRVQKDEIVTGILDHAESLKTEIDTDHDAYVNQLIQQLEKATHQIAELKKAHRFPGVTEQSRAGNSIIEYYSRFGFILDALDWDDSECGYRLMFYVGRNPRFISAEMLNAEDLPEKLKELTGAIALPKFVYNNRGGHVVLEVQKRKPKKKEPSEADITRLLTPIDKLATMVIREMSRKSTIRIMGATGDGKGICARYLLSEITKSLNWYVRLHDPQDGSAEDYWGIPKVSNSGVEMKKALKAISKQMLERESSKVHDPVTLDVLDEIDTQLEKDDKGQFLDLISRIRHLGMKLILIGQNPKVSRAGFQWSDMGQMIAFYQGSVALDAIKNNPALELKRDILLKQYEEISTVFEDKNQDLDDSKKHYYGLCVIPGKSPIWYELPVADGIEIRCDSMLLGKTFAIPDSLLSTVNNQITKLCDNSKGGRSDGITAQSTAVIDPMQATIGTADTDGITSDVTVSASCKKHPDVKLRPQSDGRYFCKSCKKRVPKADLEITPIQPKN